MPRTYRPEIDTRWQEFAACIAAPPELFYPELRNGVTWEDPQVQQHVQDVTAAYCIGCPVRLECLTHALAFPEPDGNWAGSTPSSRQAALKGDVPAARLLHRIETREVPPLPEEHQQTA